MYPTFTGHRFRPIHDFGYVALDIVDLIAEDSGTYTCRAVNLMGSDETTCNLECRSKLFVCKKENKYFFPNLLPKVNEYLLPVILA